MGTFVLVLGLLVGSVRMDLEGSGREKHADAHCANVAAALSRHGLSERERRHLAEMDCRHDSDGVWRSTKVFSQ